MGTFRPHRPKNGGTGERRPKKKDRPRRPRTETIRAEISEKNTHPGNRRARQDKTLGILMLDRHKTKEDQKSTETRHTDSPRGQHQRTAWPGQVGRKSAASRNSARKRAASTRHPYLQPRGPTGVSGTRGGKDWAVDRKGGEKGSRKLCSKTSGASSEASPLVISGGRVGDHAVGGPPAEQGKKNP